MNLYDKFLVNELNLIDQPKENVLLIMHIQFMALSMVLLYKVFLRTVKKVYLQHRVSLINVICHLSITFPKTVVII